MSGTTSYCSLPLSRQISTNCWLPSILADQYEKLTCCYFKYANSVHYYTLIRNIIICTSLCEVPPNIPSSA